MTEVPKPLDAALDLLVYAPVGLALTAAEEIPKLAAKGRTKVNTQLMMARVVGQFAVTRGRQELEKRFAPAPPAPPEPPASSVDVLADDLDEQTPVTFDEMTATNGSGPGSGAGSGLPGAERTEGGRAVSVSTVGDLATVADTAESATPPPAAEDLAIPGYDSLSASQVVQRLAGLSGDELRAVASYERAHRGRRTILNRIDQLQGQ